MFGARLILITSYLFTSIQLYGQPIPYDSAKVKTLINSVSANRKDTVTVNELISLAQMYNAVSDSARVILYAERANAMAREINFNEGIIRSLGVMAFVYSSRGDWPNATLKINEARPYCTGPEEKYQIFFYNMMFINSMTKNDPAAAKNWALKSLQHPLFNTLPEINQWPTFMQLGFSYLNENNLDSAAYYANLIKDFPTTLKTPDLSDGTRYLLGDLALKRKNYDEALSYYRWNEPGYFGMASVYHEKGQADSAIYYAEKSLEKAKSRGDHRVELETLDLLADIYKNSDPKKSNAYLKEFITVKDELFNTEKLRSLEEVRLNEQKKFFETEERETRFRNRMVQFGLIALVLIFLISALLLYRNNKIRYAANQKLEKAYTELKQTQAQLIQAEKMASLGELTAGIAHEIQNPLNFVNNFSQLNTELVAEGLEAMSSGNLGDAEEIFHTVADNEQKILQHGKRADSIVKGMLQHSRTSTGVRELTDLNALAEEYLRLTFHGLRAKDKSFNSEYSFIPDPNAGKINVVPQDMGRVILNLINNAFYAVKEKAASAPAVYKPMVVVSTVRSGDKVILTVKDNGKGIPAKIKDKIFQPFFTTKPTGEGTGLGLSLSYDIVKAHGGEIKVESQDGEGTVFSVLLPV